jgi:hypothetical protein
MDCDKVNPLNADCKVTPTPLKGTLCVETAVPFVVIKVTSAANEPVAVGSKTTCRLHVPPPAKLLPPAGHVLLLKLKSEAFGPVRAMLVKLTGDAEGFVTFIVCEKLGVPVTCELKIKFGGARVSAVACEGDGCAGIKMPNGVVSVNVDVMVFVDDWMMETVFEGGLAT